MVNNNQAIVTSVACKDVNVFIIQVFIEYYVPGTSLGAGHMLMNKVDKNPYTYRDTY